MYEAKKSSTFMMQRTMIILITERIVMDKRKFNRNLTNIMKSPFPTNTKSMKKVLTRGKISQTVIILAANMTNTKQNTRKKSTTLNTISMMQSMIFPRKNSEAKRIFIVTTTRSTMPMMQKTSKLRNLTNRMTSLILKIVATKRVRNTSDMK